MPPRRGGGRGGGGEGLVGGRMGEKGFVRLHGCVAY